MLLYKQDTERDENGSAFIILKKQCPLDLVVLNNLADIFHRAKGANWNTSDGETIQDVALVGSFLIVEFRKVT